MAESMICSICHDDVISTEIGRWFGNKDESSATFENDFAILNSFDIELKLDLSEKCYWMS